MEANLIKEKPKASATDILRVCAVLGCMWQALVVMVSKNATGEDFSRAIMLSTLVRYTAATFIFANVFDLAKLRNIKYKKQIATKARNLLIPYFLWTMVYIFLIFPTGYHNIFDVIKALIFGTAASNLWYTVMMFQFELLVIPIILLSKKLEKNKNLVPIFLIVGFLIYFVFLYIYNRFAFKTTNVYLGYLDRTFIMFSIYAVLGIVASTYEDKWNKFIDKVKFIAIPCIIVVYGISVSIEFSKTPVSYDNISYLTPIMFVYNVLVVIVLYAFARAIIKHFPKALVKLKWLNTYAFRTYLSYIVYLYIIVNVIFKDRLYNIPHGLRLILVYAMTATFTFLSSYVFHVLKVYLFDGLILRKKVQI